MGAGQSSTPFADPGRMSVNWFFANARRVAPQVQLFCLPYAGASAAVYRTWGELVGPEVEVLSAQLPGRGWRLREAPASDLVLLARQVAEAIAARADRPFAVFGHSMGAWLGLEVVRSLEAVGRAPLLFFASGRQAPLHGCTQPPMSHLDDEAFVGEVQTRYGGIPAELLAERELLALLLPALRADIELLERHEHAPDAPIRTPIHAVVGDTDPVVSRAEMEAWALETSGDFRLTELRGGHFYFQQDPSALLSLIRDQLTADDRLVLAKGA
jgi:surfactin synthase thioesterase subunit